MAIFVSSVNGGGLNQMTTPDRDVENIEPAWSPTGRQIAFASNQDQYFDIYVLDISRGNVTSITIALLGRRMVQVLLTRLTLVVSQRFS